MADVRFKLLAFLPTLGGIAVFVLSGVGLQAGESPIPATPERLVVVLLVSLLGFLATLGITLYDQRNSELYNALIHRAKYLETQFGVPGAPGGLKPVTSGGQFNERPQKSRSDLPGGPRSRPALIYGPLLGAWFFPMLYAAVARGRRQPEGSARRGRRGRHRGAWLYAPAHRLDRQEMQLYHIAAERDRLS